MTDISIVSVNRSMNFSSKNGNVIGLAFRGKSIPLDGNDFFTLGLRDPKGNLEILSSSAMTFHAEITASQTVFHYSAHPLCPDMKISVSIRADGGFFHFRPSVHGIPDPMILEWIDVPQITVPAGGTLFWPYTEGVLIDEPEKREASPWSRYHVLGFLGRTEGIAYSESGYYPGVCQMQFLSWEKDGTVLYFGAHDRKHGTKAVEYAPQKNGNVRLSLQTFCGGESPYCADFDYVLGALEGNWMDACGIYRDWIADDPMMPKKGNFPEMVKNSPVVMIYPVRGHGDDKGHMTEGNDYFPYDAAMPSVNKFAIRMNSRILSLLMHWEGTAPWAPPFVWPPWGGVEELKKYSDSLHSQGHYLGVYCSGSAWTQKSCIVEYSREEECEKNGLRRHMIRGPKGEIDAVICCAPQAQRLGFDLCLTEDWSRRVLLDEVAKLTECEIDYAQFFDQNLGGAFHPCYSRNHRHPPVPGRWQTETMRSLLSEMRSELAAKKSNMILGCEAGAADVYLKELPFSDLRSCWNWGYGIPVPGYQFIFHEYVNNFMGNQCGITGVFDCEASPENLLYRTAYAFNCGDLLSFVLKDSGKIHWAWGALWEMPEPEQSSIITLIRNLNAIRRANPEILLYGKMVKPSEVIETKTWTASLQGGTTRALPSVLHSEWEAPDGSRSCLLVNYMPEEQTVMRNGKEQILPRLNAVVLPVERGEILCTASTQNRPRREDNDEWDRRVARISESSCGL